MREVARRAGVSHAAPYHHFADKQALLGAVAEEGFRRLDAYTARAMRQGGTPPERLQRMGRAYIRFAVKHPHYYRVMFKPKLRRLRGDIDLSTASGKAFQRLLEAVADCRRAVGDEKADPLTWALVAWTITHGVSSLWIEGALSAGPLQHLGIERIAEVVTRTVMPVFSQPPAKA